MLAGGAVPEELAQAPLRRSAALQHPPELQAFLDRTLLLLGLQPADAAVAAANAERLRRHLYDFAAAPGFSGRLGYAGSAPPRFPTALRTAPALVLNGGRGWNSYAVRDLLGQLVERLQRELPGPYPAGPLTTAEDTLRELARPGALLATTPGERVPHANGRAGWFVAEVERLAREGKLAQAQPDTVYLLASAWWAFSELRRVKPEIDPLGP